MTTLKLHGGGTLNLLTKQLEGEDDLQPPDDLFSPAPPVDIRLEDLPADPRTMNVVCSVLSYVFIGIREHDIALALGCTAAQLTEIIESEAYIRSRQMVLDSFVRGQQHAARDVISANAVHAARELVRTMRGSKSESNRLKASEGVLNRAGISDTGSMDNMSDGLVIRVVRDTKTSVEIKVG